MSSTLCKLCTCCCLCGLLAVCLAGGFVATWGFTIWTLLPGRAEDLVLSEPFNDGGCELLGEDLIRGGNSLALWKDGIVIVSAGDLNTTFRHYSRGARGAGIFAVDLKAAGKRPAVRALELLDWPKRLPPLVGQGLFLSNASGRLYVVNHGAEREEQPQEEQEYQVGKMVQGFCCCCGRWKWSEALVAANLGNGSYWCWWLSQNVTEVLMTWQMRRPKIKSRRETIVWESDPACPSGETFASVPLTLEECRETPAMFPGHTLAEPFAQYLEDMPPGCFTYKKVHTFNLNSNGSRRAGRMSLCKHIEVEFENAEKHPIGVGFEQEGPESFVEVFEILGEDFESLRLRHVDRVGSDLFPYQGISQVAEGRNSSEIFVLRELPWRSTTHEHNLVEGSRNSDGPVNWLCSLWFWYWHWLGFKELGKSITWMSRNGKKFAGNKRYSDHGPVGGDIAVVRCERLPKKTWADQGVPVLGGLRWSCNRTLKGLPPARGFAISPDRSEILLGVRTRVMRYRIEEDGNLAEVGLPLQVSAHGWVTGLWWEEPDLVFYSFQPAPSLLPQYRLRFLRRPGVPAEVVVGKPPDSSPAGWWSNFWTVLVRPPAQLTTAFRHDGSLLGGQISSWVHYDRALLLGSDWEEGLLYCPSLPPASGPDIREGDRVWAQVDPTPGAMREKQKAFRRGTFHSLSWSVFELNTSQNVASLLVSDDPLSGVCVGLDVIFRYRPHRYEWRLATVLESNGSDFEVAWDKAPPESSPTAKRPASRLQAIPAARGPVRPRERVEALDARGQWRGATVEEDHGDGNFTVTWESEVVGGWALRRREGDGKLVVRFASSGEQAAGTCRGRCLTDVGSPFGPQPGGHTFGWVLGEGGLASVAPGSAGEGSCSAGAAEEGGGKCASSEGSGSRPSPAEGLLERPVWELAVPNGFYEATIVLRPGAGAASMSDCSLEGQAVQGSGVTAVRIADGRLTLGGCRGLLDSLAVRSVPAEEAMSTPFFHGKLGIRHSIGHFETHTSLEHADGRFLRRVPAGLTADNTTFVATVRGGSCGPRASVSFRVDDVTLRYFQHGEQAGWRPLREVRELSGNPVMALPTRIFTGEPGQEGWILCGGPNKLTFASTYTSFDFHELCDGWPLFGGETATLSFLAGPPPPAGGALLPEHTGPLKVGDRAELVIPVRGGQQALMEVAIKSRNPDGTFTVERDGATVEDSRLPAERIRRTQEAGFRRHFVGGSALYCRGRSSWTPPASSMNGCLRLCAVRPLCRFVAFLPQADMAQVHFNCIPSDECSELLDLGAAHGEQTWIYEKLDA